MEARELRIGNLVYAFKGIWEIDHTCFLAEQISTYNPIDLTEEWLSLNTEFERVTDFPDNNEYIIPISEDNEYLEIRFIKGIVYCRLIFKVDGKIVNQFPLRRLKWIHDLQNLIFTLSGEELTIK